MKYDPRLEGARGMAALWVFVYHFGRIFLTDNGLIWIPVISAGYLGVPLFLILSISLLLARLDDNDDTRHYFWRRIKRIWPLYFLSVITTYLLVEPNFVILIGRLTFTSQLWAPDALRTVFWTLQVEEWAYLTYPLIHKLVIKWKFRLALILIVLGIAVAPITIFTPWYYIPLSLDSFGFGILVYLQKFNDRKFRYLLIGLIPIMFFPDWYPAQIWHASPLLAIPVFAILLAHPPKFLGWFVPRTLGAVSYSLYLFHVLFFQLFSIFGAILIWPLLYILEGRRIKGRLNDAIPDGPAFTDPLFEIGSAEDLL